MLLGLSASGWGHGDLAHDLAGRTLCLEPTSISVSVEGGPTPGEAEAFMRSQLVRSLAATFESFQLPFQEREACERDRVFSSLIVQSQDTSSRVDFWLLLEVGGGGGASLAAAADPPAFELAFASSFFEEGLSEPYLVLLPRLGEASYRDLAIAWWEDNPESRSKRLPLPALLGAALALLVLTAGIVWRWRRRRSASSA